MNMKWTKILAAVAAAGTACAGRAETVVFEDKFEADSSANWSVFNASDSGTPDFAVTWAYDYGTFQYTLNGVAAPIPAAPNSSGTTKGVRVSVNKDDVAERSGVNLYPTGKSFSGNYALRFDMWINYNGGAYGGTGSTEFGIFGINHLGTQPNYAAANPDNLLPTSDGVWFGVTGEAGANRDYRTYEGDAGGNPLEMIGADGGFLDRDGSGTIEQEVLPAEAPDAPLNFVFPSPPYETLGVPGKRWVQVEVRQRNGVITWLINGYVIAEKQNITAWTAGNIMIGTMDIFASVADPKADNFVLFDNVRVVNLGADAPPPRLALEATKTAGAEPGTSGEITITRTGDSSKALEITLLAGGNAQSGKDYAVFPLTTNLAVGANSLVIPVTVLDDPIGEQKETARFTLAANPANPGQYEVFSPTVAKVEIEDDGDVTFAGITVLDAVLDEGISGEGAVFSIYRLGDASVDLTVNLAASGTAQADEYSAIAPSIVIPAGSTNILLMVDSAADAADEEDETVILTVEPGDGYTVQAGNASATATIREAGALLFTENFETDVSANYNVLFSAANGLADYRAGFGLDYGLIGIAPSPRGTGTTRGLLLTVNKDEATAAGAASVNVFPKGQGFSGNYLLKFDMFLTYDASAAGTTEHAAFGINHSGALTNRHGAAGSDGVWFAVETDGSGSGGGRSYVTYMPVDAVSAPAFEAKAATEFVRVFTVPPFLAAGAASGDWVDVSVRHENGTVTWKINNNVIFEKSNTGPSKSGSVMLGYMDTFNSIGGTNNFVVYDNLRVIRLGGAPAQEEISITKVQRTTQGQIQIEFTTTGAVAGLSVESAAVAKGAYASEPNAQIESISASAARATIPLAAVNRFFRIKR